MVLKAHPSDVSNAAVNISINLSEETGYLYPPILDLRAIVHL